MNDRNYQRAKEILFKNDFYFSNFTEQEKNEYDSLNVDDFSYMQLRIEHDSIGLDKLKKNINELDIFGLNYYILHFFICIIEYQDYDNLKKYISILNELRSRNFLLKMVTDKSLEDATGSADFMDKFIIDGNNRTSKREMGKKTRFNGFDGLIPLCYSKNYMDLFDDLVDICLYLIREMNEKGYKCAEDLYSFAKKYDLKDLADKVFKSTYLSRKIVYFNKDSYEIFFIGHKAFFSKDDDLNKYIINIENEMKYRFGAKKEIICESFNYLRSNLSNSEGCVDLLSRMLVYISKMNLFREDSNNMTSELIDFLFLDNKYTTNINGEKYCGFLNYVYFSFTDKFEYLINQCLLRFVFRAYSFNEELKDYLFSFLKKIDCKELNDKINVAIYFSKKYANKFFILTMEEYVEELDRKEYGSYLYIMN